MRAGRMRHQVVLQSPTGSRDSVGERTTTWTDVATVWANIRPLTGREQFLASQREASTSHIVEIRYSTDVSTIDASWRVKYGTRLLVLDGDPINVEERGIQLNLPCVEGLREE